MAHKDVCNSGADDDQGMQSLIVSCLVSFGEVHIHAAVSIALGTPAFVKPMTYLSNPKILLLFQRDHNV